MDGRSVARGTACAGTGRGADWRIVVCDGRVIGRGCNRPITENDPTAHAEILALREAGRELGNYRLENCDLFVTVEPCAMCAGAITHARIRRLIYGAEDPKAGGVTSVIVVLNHQGLNHQVEVTPGVLAGRSRARCCRLSSARSAATQHEVEHWRSIRRCVATRY